MKTNKPFKTLRQQLKILRDRNLIIKDGEKAIKILKREGYYNIINGYKNIFLDDVKTKALGEDCYKENVKFEHIYALYDFDRNIRAILLKSILKAETCLKTKIAYYFSETYQASFSYLDINNFESDDPQKITKLISKLSEVINRNSQKQEQGGQIYHYLTKYKELPLWVLTKKMTLGETQHFFALLRQETKDKIIKEIIFEFCKEYKREGTILVNARVNNSFHAMLSFLNNFRNMCAHEERIYNTVIKFNSKIPQILLFHIPKDIQFKSRVFDCIVILSLFLTKKEYNDSLKEIENEIGKLIKNLPGNLLNNVLISMGFSKTWKDDLKL